MDHKKEQELPALTLDDKDMGILRLLQQDAKMTIRDIARQLNLSTTPVYERIRKMEQAGVIRQYAAIVDPRKINKGMTVLVYITLKEHNKKNGKKFIQEIVAFQEVTECLNISGEFDFMIKVQVKDMDEYREFYVNKLGELDNLSHTQSIFVISVIKETHQVVY
ncbi:Lrp/AsnC family transcriptional regulator [Chitinophaga oryzae]|uniref:Lrp/AsnC family transcriptional regulator n=1 Tax=Chitinophaga oryzae TaxID=2725414 RepID=A0AAE6ZPQ8_9BACT|nr:Lrp/AsnC family transcriptional regulator [Chitinophaga oryzae]QJB35390.1 Lrp/AsnC family transcriptional regulator [Chitinophaga oryzae]QJB41926.1 Lrp/AsnC family transcriptional regulator [Chitinophaga oryzae]